MLDVDVPAKGGWASGQLGKSSPWCVVARLGCVWPWWIFPSSCDRGGSGTHQYSRTLAALQHTAYLVTSSCLCISWRRKTSPPCMGHASRRSLTQALMEAARDVLRSGHMAMTCEPAAMFLPAVTLHIVLRRSMYLASSLPRVSRAIPSAAICLPFLSLPLVVVE